MTDHWIDHPKTLQVLTELVCSDLVPLGRLTQFTAAEDVLKRLKSYPPVKLPDYTTSGTTLLHTRDLGVCALSRMCISVLHTAVHTGKLDPSTKVYLYYRQGNLFAFMKSQDLPKTVTLSLDVYLTVDTSEQCLVGYHIGKLHTHHALYDYRHLDSKMTTIEKLLKTNRFTSIYIGSEEDFGLCDIPL